MKISRQVPDEPKACPQWQDSLAAIDRVDLSPERRAALRQHLMECPQCRAVNNEYRSMNALFTGLTTQRVLDGIPARLQELFEATEKGNILMPNETFSPQQPAPRVRALSQSQIEGGHSHPLMKTFNQIAIVLVLCVILGGFLFLMHGRQSTTTASYNNTAKASTLYITTTENTIIALNATNGTRTWETPLGGMSTSPVISQGNVYFMSVGGVISAIHGSNGKLLWHTHVGKGTFVLPSGLIAYNNLIIVSTNQGDIYAFNALNGSAVWKAHFAACTANVISHDTATAATGNFGPSALDPCDVWLRQQANGVIYGYSLGLYAWNASTGKVIWHNKNTSVDYLHFLVTGHTIYAPAVDNKTYQTIDVLDSSDGHYIRTIHTSTSADVEAMQADANTLYVLTVKTGHAPDKTVVDVSDQLHAYKLSDGTLLWQKTSTSDQVFDSLTLANGHLYVLIDLRTPGYGDIASRSPKDTVYAFNPANGSQIWKSQQFSGLAALFSENNIIGLAQSNGIVPNSKMVIYRLQPDNGSQIWHFSFNGDVFHVIAG